MGGLAAKQGWQGAAETTFRRYGVGRTGLEAACSSIYGTQCQAPHKCCELPDHGFIPWAGKRRNFPGKPLPNPAVGLQQQ